MRAAFRIEGLAPGHDREAFASGVAPFDRYLRELASQDVKRRVSNCFVALTDQGQVAGYYTFAASSIPLVDLPPDISKRLPRYGVVPAGLIGRLAVDHRFQGQRLGAALVIDAALRAGRGDPAIFALIVDAKNDKAVAFYEHLQFRRFGSRPMSLFLPLSVALKAHSSSA